MEIRPRLEPRMLPIPSPEPEPEPEETEEQRRARLIKKMEDIFAAAEPMENYTFTLNDPVTVEGRNTTMVCGSASSPITIPSPAYLSTVAEFFITPDGEKGMLHQPLPRQ